MAHDDSKLPRQPTTTGTQSVDAFLRRAQDAPLPVAGRTSARLLFAIDATASRQPTWDLATELHAALFDEVARLGNITVQLAYFRGIGEFVASPWLATAEELKQRMLGVHCQGGRTQFLRLLAHALTEASARPVRAVVFIGDCFEESETELARLAGQLALRNLPLLLFQEGHDATAMRAFGLAARLTGGAHVPFEPGAADALRRLLGAAVRYATGGCAALADFARRSGDRGPQALLEQLER
jgi:hypothetical protein